MALLRRGSTAALLAFSGALCALTPGRASAADAPPVAVVSIQTEDVLDQAEALTTALKQGLRRTPGWALQEGEWALEVLTVSLECAEPPDAACETKMADQLKAERLLWGTLKRKDGATVTGQLHLWTRGQGSQVATIDYSANLTEANDESLAAVASEALGKLAGGAPEGKVHLRVGTVNGQVLENGKVVGTLTNGEATLSLPPGRHALSVRGEGTTDLETFVEVKSRTTTEVELQPQAPPGGPDWQKIAGFGTIGLGVGFAVVGVISSLQIQTLNDDLDPARQYVASDQDVCDVASSGVGNPGFDTASVQGICDDASTFETLQMIMYPLAAVSIGTGVVLLTTADWSGEPATATEASRRSASRRELVVHPRVGVGPEGIGHGNVRFSYTF